MNDEYKFLETIDNGIWYEMLNWIPVKSTFIKAIGHYKKDLFIWQKNNYIQVFYGLGGWVKRILNAKPYPGTEIGRIRRNFYVGELIKAQELWIKAMDKESNETRVN